MTYYPIRSMFVAPPGYYLVQWDFSQAETWVVAYLANEERMQHSLRFGDIHTDTASAIFNVPMKDVTKIQRYLGKKANHSLSYGSTYFMLARSINHESDQPPYVTVSLSEAKGIFDGWHNLYSIQEWWSDIRNELQRNRTLVTPYGRRRAFFERWGQELFKEAYAYKPQSTVADHTNGAIQPELGISGGIIEIRRTLVSKGALRLVNQSHDSIIAEVPKAAIDDIITPVTNLLRRPLIINGQEFTIPVDCEYGNRWGELEKVS